MNQMTRSREPALSWPSPSVVLVGVMAGTVAVGALVTRDHFVVSLLAAPVIPVTLGTVWRSMRASASLARSVSRGEPSHIHIPRPQRGGVL